MRLPFPERIPLYPTLIFALGLCLLQQVEGTTPLFSACTFGFILLATLSFNMVGGLTRPSGGFILAYTILAALFGITFKVFLGEPGQSNLLQPDTTIEVYCGASASMLAAAFLSKQLRREKSFIPKFTSDQKMARAAVSCFAIGIFLTVYLTFLAGAIENGSFMSAFLQLNAFYPLAIILGVISTIRMTGGKRSLSLVAALSCLLVFAEGVKGYSKQGMFTPFACWLIAAASQRYKLSIVQIGGILVSLGLVTYYLVPYSQYGRAFRVEGESFSEGLKTNILLLSNLETVRKVSKSRTADEYLGTDVGRYYNQPQGLADRLQMLTPDDLIISYTEQGGVFGLAPTLFAYANLVPHFIWHDKPIVGFGNIYAHEVGILPPEDTTTGISFSPSGEAFHQAKWTGIFVLLPVLLFLLFVVVDSAFGDTRDSPVALVAMIGFFHTAPEGGVIDVIRGPTFVTAEFFIIGVIVVYLIPIFADLIVGPIKKSAVPNSLTA